MTEWINLTVKYIIASYVEDNHKKWEKYIPEFHFALNSADQETTGISPAELQLWMKLKSPMDKRLQSGAATPDSPPYHVVHELKLLQCKRQVHGQVNAKV